MIEEVDFSIPLNQIASDYWFEEGETDWVLKSSKTPIKPKGNLEKYLGYNDTKRLPVLYREFLEILRTFFSFTPPLDEKDWLEILDKESPKYNELVATQVMGRIVDHAKEFGMGWMKPVKSKVLNDAGIGQGGVRVPYLAYQIKKDDDWEMDVYPNEPTLKNIVSQAMIMYEALEWNYEEWASDDVFTTYFNKLAQPKMTATPQGIILSCEGYWECLWLSFSMDSRRLHASKCGFCHAPVIKVNKAKFCNDLCRSRFNNQRYREEKKKIQKQDIKELSKNLAKIEEELSTFEKQINKKSKSKAKLEEALKNLEKAVKEAKKIEGK